MKTRTKKKPAPVTFPGVEIARAMLGPIREACAEVATKAAAYTATRSDGRSVAVTVPARETDEDGIKLASVIVGLEIERLADAILTAANEPPITRWERADLWIALRLGSASVWTAALDDMEFQAPTVVEALRGLLALVSGQ